jgi:citrate lyase subunit beta / citryl-CoA lyase
MTAPVDAVTALFVPGDRPERFAKAVAAGPDLVIIDLEDAVAADAKSAALEAILAALSPQPPSSAADGSTSAIRSMVRVNPSGSPGAAGEIAALSQLINRRGHGLIGLMVPKAENPDVIAELIATMTPPDGSDLAVIPLVESARGVVRAVDLAAVPGVTRLAFGALDFTLDVGADLGSTTVGYARAQLVIASRAAGIAAPFDSPATQVADLDAVADSARTARAQGFGGKLCIHPAQVSVVRDAFRPSDAEIEWARSVLDAEGGAVQIGGQMVDRPVVERARRILERFPDQTGRFVARPAASAP